MRRGGAWLVVGVLLTACSASPEPRPAPSPVSTPPSPAPAWALRIGGPRDDLAVGLATDGEGNVYVAGTYERSIDLGAGEVPSHGLTDVFVASYDRRGRHRWSRRVGDRGRDRPSGIWLSGDRVAVGAVVDFVRDFGGERRETDEESQAAFVHWAAASGTDPREPEASAAGPVRRMVHTAAGAWTWSGAETSGRSSG